MTIRERFDVDSNTNMVLASEFEFRSEASDVPEKIPVRLIYHFEANAKYWYVFLSKRAHFFEYLEALLDFPAIKNCEISSTHPAPNIDLRWAGSETGMVAHSLKFTGRVHLYTDQRLTSVELSSIVLAAKARGIFIVVRGIEYATHMSMDEMPLAFISHDSRDKEPFVKELALELWKLKCPVWYDEYSLSVGDSLRASIEKGLRNVSKCILILSPNFITNKGWGLAEYDAIFTREILEKSSIILPVWHNVGVKEVFEYSPRLADKVGISSNLGAAMVALKLQAIIRPAVSPDM